MNAWRSQTRVFLGLVILLVGSTARLAGTGFSIDQYRKTIELAHGMYARVQDYQTAFILPVTDLCIPSQSESIQFPDDLSKHQSGACTGLNLSKLACLNGQPEEAWELLVNTEASCPREALMQAWALQLTIAQTGSDAIEDLLIENEELPLLLINWGRALARHGQPEHGQELLALGLESSTDQALAINKAIAYGELADLHRVLGRPQEAILTYQKALEHGGRPSRWLIGLGIAYRQLMDYDSSRQTFQTALEAAQDNPGTLSIIYEQLGVTELQADRKAAAQQAFAQAYCQLMQSSDHAVSATRVDRIKQLLQRSGSEPSAETSCP